MRKFSALVIILVMMLCSSAQADIVYLTYSGDIGLVELNGSESADLVGTLYTTSWSDPFLGSYWDGSDTRVILVDRTTDTTTSGDTALVFNPSNLARPIDSTRKVLAGVYYAQAMAGSDNGRAVFFVSGNSIHEFSTGDFSLTRSYTYKPKTSEDITSEIGGLITGSNVIYLLVQQTNSRDVLLEFDGQLRDDVSTNFRNYPLSSDAAAISWLDASRVAIGHEYGVDVWTDRSGLFRILSTDNPVKAVCQDAGSGFYFIEQSESDGIYTTTLKHYSAGEVSTLFANTEGWACRLVRDGDNGIFGAIVGDEIRVYRMEKDILLGEYDSTSLEGFPAQIAVSRVSVKKDKDNSGCSLSLSGMWMMIFLAGVCTLSRKQ